MRPSLTVMAALSMATCSPVAERDPGWQQRAVSLAGVWDIQLSIHRDYLWPGKAAENPSIHGSMILIVNRTMENAYPRVGVPTNYGLYTADFSPWGFAPAAGHLPAVVAGSVASDSIGILFEAGRPGLGMMMIGRVSGDTIRGGWQLTEGRSAARSGAFVMTRTADCCPSAH